MIPNHTKLHILAIGVHPDDVELSCAGTLLVELQRGNPCGILDLTQGELGTRGTVITRKAEATHAAAVLGITIRENLSMQDGFVANDKAHQLSIIQVLRKYQPNIVLCNAPEDRHPDHGRTATLVADACFLSGLRKIETHHNGTPQQAWRPKQVLHYIQDRYLQPNFVIDISAVHHTKMEAIRCYTTQFNSADDTEPQTYISQPNFLAGVVNRAAMYGKMIGVDYAEGFITKKMVGLRTLNDLISEDT